MAENQKQSAGKCSAAEIASSLFWSMLDCNLTTDVLMCSLMCTFINVYFY